MHDRGCQRGWRRRSIAANAVKIAIVSAAAIQDHPYSRLDAEHYLGLVDGKEPQAAVEDAKRRVDTAIARLSNTITSAAFAYARVQQLIKEGKVVPIGPA